MKIKSTYFAVGFSVILFSCSTTQELSVTTNESFQSGVNTSYGPKGQIITKSVDIPNVVYGLDSEKNVSESSQQTTTDLTASTESVIVSNKKPSRIQETHTFLKEQAEQKSFIYQFHKKK